VRAEQHGGGNLASATYFHMEGGSIELERLTAVRRR